MIRKKHLAKTSLFAAWLAAIAQSTLAEEPAGIQLSLVPDVAIESRDTPIKGVSFGLWNENPGSQWQIGLINGSTGESVGFQSFIPFVFFPAVINYADSHTGAQLGLFNWVVDDFTGAQLGLINGTGQLTGFQWGAGNYAKIVDSGVQLGWANYTEEVRDWALQIGLVNVIADNNWFSDFPNDLAKGFVIVNWSFGN